MFLTTTLNVYKDSSKPSVILIDTVWSPINDYSYGLNVIVLLVGLNVKKDFKDETVIDLIEMTCDVSASIIPGKTYSNV